RELRGAFLDLYDRIANWDLLIRKVTVIANHLVDEEEAAKQVRTEQLNLFEDPHQKVAEQQSAQSTRDQEHEVQELVLKLQEQYGKNAIIRAADLLDGSTTRKRNDEIGGHKA
ncbi:LytTR family transcriptional regulator, partial [Limosilactobacillus fermentum]